MTSSLHASRIEYLARGHFHPDFDLDADEPIGIIRNFRLSETASNIERLRDEIAEILARDPSEGDFASVWINQAGSYYDPRDDGTTLLEWFHHMLSELSGPSSEDQSAPNAPM